MRPFPRPALVALPWLTRAVSKQHHRPDACGLPALLLTTDSSKMGIHQLQDPGMALPHAHGIQNRGYNKIVGAAS